MSPMTWTVLVHLDGIPRDNEQQTNLGYATATDTETNTTQVLEKVTASDLLTARTIAMTRVSERARAHGFPGDVLGADTPVLVPDEMSATESPEPDDPDIFPVLPDGPRQRTRIPEIPDLTRSRPPYVTRGDLRAWLEATAHLLADDTPVFLASDSEGNQVHTLAGIGVEPYRTWRGDGRYVETVHPDDLEDDEALPVAIVLWP